MIKGGTGGGNTQSGLRFEARINIGEALTKIPGFEIKGHEVYKDGVKVAHLYSKHRLYSLLLAERKIDYRILSKKLLPDEAILVGDTLYIVEMKFQFVAGSVDEKLQTCDFKKRQYSKLFNESSITVQYVYVLNDWFKKPEYKDVLEYVSEVGCFYFFNEIPLSFLKLQEP